MTIVLHVIWQLLAAFGLLLAVCWLVAGLTAVRAATLKNRGNNDDLRTASGRGSARATRRPR